MNTSSFTYVIEKNEEGDLAIEFLADEKPICSGSLCSLRPRWIERGNGRFPNIRATASDYLGLREGNGEYWGTRDNEKYEKYGEYPEDSVLIAVCSCGAPSCGHQWGIETRLGKHMRLEVYGNYSFSNPSVFHFLTSEYDEAFIQIWEDIKGGLFD